MDIKDEHRDTETQRTFSGRRTKEQILLRYIASVLIFFCPSVLLSKKTLCLRASVFNQIIL